MRREQLHTLQDITYCYRPIVFEFKRKLIDSFFRNSTQSSKTKAYYQYIKTRNFRKTTYIRQRCRCRITGRARFVITLGGMTRLTFRFFSGLGCFRSISRTGF